MTLTPRTRLANETLATPSSPAPPSSAPPSPARSAAVLLTLLLLNYAIAAIGALSTLPSIPTWYAALHKPSFNPPNWLFGPAWTILYTLMAVAAWLVWRQTIAWRHTTQRRHTVPAPLYRNARIAYFAQLFFNFCWTPIFFQHHQVLLALALIVILWLLILITLRLFWRIRPLAGALLIPYLAWVAFATALNFALWRLN